MQKLMVSKMAHVSIEYGRGNNKITHSKVCCREVIRVLNTYSGDFNSLKKRNRGEC